MIILKILSSPSAIAYAMNELISVEKRVLIVPTALDALVEGLYIESQYN